MMTFKEQLRKMQNSDPELYESISCAYAKILTESSGNQASHNSSSNDDDTIMQSSTKGVESIMDKIHSMVGVNEKKKEGEKILDTSNDDVDTVKPDEEQTADLMGKSPDESANLSDNAQTALDNLFADSSASDENREETPDDYDPFAEGESELFGDSDQSESQDKSDAV